MSIKHTRLLENTSFAKLCSYAEDEEDIVTSSGDSARKVIRGIINRASKEYDLSADIGDNTLARIKKNLAEQIRQARLSDGFKTRVINGIQEKDNLLSLLIWLQNLVAATEH